MDRTTQALQMLLLITYSSYYNTSVIVYSDGPISNFIIVSFLSVFIDVNQLNR